MSEEEVEEEDGGKRRSMSRRNFSVKEINNDS